MNLYPFIATGIGLGAVYGMAGVGLVILYRASGTLNFAFGALGALAAHVTWTLIENGLAVLPAWGIGILVASGSSLLYGRLVSARLVERDRTVRAIATLGLALFLLGGITTIWGPGLPRRLALPIDHMSVTLLGIRLTYTRIAVFLFAVLAVIAIALLLNRTRIGLAMRAMASSRPISSLIGIPVVRTDSIAWLISGAFAGVAGLMLSVLLVMSPIPLTFLVIPAIAAAVLGGLTSMTGALVGGLVCGMAEALLTGVPGMPVYRSAAPYLIALLFIALATRARLGARE